MGEIVINTFKKKTERLPEFSVDSADDIINTIKSIYLGPVSFEKQKISHLKVSGENGILISMGDKSSLVTFNNGNIKDIEKLIRSFIKKDEQKTNSKLHR